MTPRIYSLYFFIFFLIALQSFCMEDSRMVTVPLKELKSLVKECSQKAVAEALRKNSPSFISSTVQFITDPKKMGTTLFYGSIIVAVLGISASKYYWLTPKKLDELFQRKEEDVIQDILEINRLVDLSQEGVKQAYAKNLLGMHAGFAALGKMLEQSKKNLGQRYDTAYKDELKRRLELCAQSRVLSQEVQTGMQAILSSLDITHKDIQQNQSTLAKQKLSLQDFEETTEKELNTLTSILSHDHNEEMGSLNFLQNALIDGNEDIHQTLLRTDLNLRVLTQTLLTIDETKEENQVLIQEAFEVVRQQEELMKQIKERLEEQTPLPGSSTEYL